MSWKAMRKKSSIRTSPSVVLGFIKKRGDNTFFQFFKQYISINKITNNATIIVAFCSIHLFESLPVLRPIQS